MMSLNPDEKEVIDQAIENCRFWGSTLCKRSTLEKYCREERDVEDPGKVIYTLIERGVLYTPKPGYVGFTEPEKWGLESESGR